MSARKVYRRTGLLERFFIARQYMKFDSCVIVVAKYTNASLSCEQISKDVLFPALAQVIQQNPVLTVRVKDEKDPTISSFESLPKIDFNSIVTFTDDRLEEEKNFRSFLERELVNVIPNSTETPLWRLSVSADNFLVFAWSHVIGDGQSGLSFHRLLLNALNNPDTPGPKEGGHLHEGVMTLPDDDTAEMLPALENLTDLSVSFMTLFKSIVKLLIPLLILLIERSVWSGHNNPRSVSTSSPMVKAHVGGMVFLSPAEAARLIASSRKHEATLTSTIYIAGISVIAKLLADCSKSETNGNRKFTKISTCVPVSLRPIAGVSNTAIGNIVSTFNRTERLHPLVTNPDGSVTIAWDAAATFSKELRKSVLKTREYIGTLKYLYNRYEKFYKERLGAKRVGGLMVSNLGAFNLAASEGEKGTALASKTWSIGRTCFVQSEAVLGPALKLSASGDPDGGVNIAISWGEGAVDNDFAEAFVQEFQTLLAGLTKADA